ncbi:hypothetical protein [Halomonas rhizosphaerae]|uniref:Uncharacterized protein n=1 Tax=Halomonas rhizosphaerae TaxID=3043296 RepID=A0ABT6V2W2_9GAMM|nr:hypothetical protein [Halomonas rhizosphaerae]MDI5892574.1 hypothetical protein [Halomonas rhizosphaerae]MDI5921951.1 hypothetical protein [Halomonas rhizosphaerae]
MNPERPRVYTTVVFLQVSFQAIKHSMAGKASDGLPCWLDGKMLRMLCRDLKACRDEAIDHDEAHLALEAASTQCDELLAHCPGGLNSTLCHRHLDAILVGLQRALVALATPTAAAPTGLWHNATRHLREGWRRLS